MSIKISNGMKTHTVKFLISISIFLMLVMPVVSLAQSNWGGLVPCATDRIKEPCEFKHFMLLLNNIIDFIFKFLALPIAALMFAYAGVTLVTSGGSTEARGKAKNIFMDALIGLVLAAASWVIIRTLLSIIGYGDAVLFF